MRRAVQRGTIAAIRRCPIAAPCQKCFMRLQTAVFERVICSYTTVFKHFTCSSTTVLTQHTTNMVRMSVNIHATMKNLSTLTHFRIYMPYSHMPFGCRPVRTCNQRRARACLAVLAGGGGDVGRHPRAERRALEPRRRGVARLPHPPVQLPPQGTQSAAIGCGGRRPRARMQANRTFVCGAARARARFQTN